MPARSGVEDETVPTCAAAQPAGSAWNVCSRQAPTTVEPRAVSSLGSTTDTECTLAWSSGCSSVTVSPAPLLAEVLPSATADSFGLNGSVSQPLAPVAVVAVLVAVSLL